MKSSFVTGIWLTTFENQSQLEGYLEWKYSENEDEPKCSFAEDAGLPYFDSDFLESFFAPAPDELLQQIDNISFAGNFKAQLLAVMKGMNYTDKNSIISLSSKRDRYGSVNEGLFDFVPPLNKRENLQFAGLFKYEDA